MLQFLRKTKFSNLPLEFCKSMERLWSTSKKHLLAASHRHLVWTDILRRCLGMSPKLITTQLPTVPQPCSVFTKKMAAEDHRSDQSSLAKLHKKGLDEAGGKPMLPCYSRRLSYLISKSIFLHDRLEN